MRRTYRSALVMSELKMCVFNFRNKSYKDFLIKNWIPVFIQQAVENRLDGYFHWSVFHLC